MFWPDLMIVFFLCSPINLSNEQVSRDGKRYLYIVFLSFKDSACEETF